MVVLSPFVYWAQNATCIFLKVDLKDVKEPDIRMDTNKLEFSSKGVGARGLQQYAFKLDFNNEINAKESVHKILDSRVEITISKKDNCWWPRLTSQPLKPAWLKIDHDKFQSEELQHDDGDEEELNPGDIKEKYPDLFKQLQKEEIGYAKESIKKVYLTIYNIFMGVGFLYVYSILIINFCKEGTAYFPKTYSQLGSVVSFLEMLQMLEAMHPLFGYVPGSFWTPFVQVGGRNFIMYFMLESEERVQKMPVVFYLFFVWCSIEIIRYPYYMMQQFKKNNALLTWLRYSAWIVLFPCGFLCEAVVIFRNLLFLEQSEKWTYTLFDYTLKFSTVLRCYLLFFIFPVFYYLMSHMHKLRKRKLASKPAAKAKSKKI